MVGCIRMTISKFRSKATWSVGRGTRDTLGVERESDFRATGFGFDSKYEEKSLLAVIDGASSQLSMAIGSI